MDRSSPVSFSHFGIYVTDLARMTDFYTRVLGMLVSDRGQVPGGSDLVFLSRDPDEHHQIVLATGRPSGVTFNVVNQISFKLPALADLKAMHARGRREAALRLHVAWFPGRGGGGGGGAARVRGGPLPPPAVRGPRRR